MSTMLTPPENPMVCGNCGEEHSDSEAMIAHVGTHITRITAPDLDVIRERVATDMENAAKGTDTIIDPTLVDNAMFAIEHSIADRFPPGSNTERVTLSLDTVGEDGGLDTLVALFAHAMDPLVDALDAEPDAREPDVLDITVTVTPRWTTGDAS